MEDIRLLLLRFFIGVNLFLSVSNNIHFAQDVPISEFINANNKVPQHLNDQERSTIQQELPQNIQIHNAPGYQIADYNKKGLYYPEESRHYTAHPDNPEIQKFYRPIVPGLRYNPQLGRPAVPEPRDYPEVKKFPRIPVGQEHGKLYQLSRNPAAQEPRETPGVHRFHRIPIGREPLENRELYQLRRNRAFQKPRENPEVQSFHRIPIGQEPPDNPEVGLQKNERLNPAEEQEPREDLVENSGDNQNVQEPRYHPELQRQQESSQESDNHKTGPTDQRHPSDYEQENPDTTDDDKQHNQEGQSRLETEDQDYLAREANEYSPWDANQRHYPFVDTRKNQHEKSQETRNDYGGQHNQEEQPWIDNLWAGILKQMQELFRRNMFSPNFQLREAKVPQQPNIIISPTSQPDVPISSKAKTDITKPSKAQPDVPISSKAQPGGTISSTAQPGVTISSKAQPGVTISSKAQPGVTISSTAQPGGTISFKAQPDVTISSKAQPDVTISSKSQPDVTISSKAQPDVPVSPSLQDTKKDSTNTTKKKKIKGQCEHDTPTNSSWKAKEVKYASFQSRVVKELRNIARKHGCHIMWYDIDGMHAKNHIKELGKGFLKYKITTFSGPTYYGRPTQCRKQKESIEGAFSMCNSDTKLAKSFKPPPQKIEHNSEISWTLEKGLKMKEGRRVSFDAKVPSSVIAPDSSLKTINAPSEKKGGTAKTSFNLRESYNIEQEFKIDPLKMLILRYISSKEEVELPFTTELILEGYVLAMYDKKFDGKKLHIYPVTKFASDVFQKRNDSLIFNATGVFKGARGITTEIHYNEETYKNGSDCQFIL